SGGNATVAQASSDTSGAAATPAGADATQPPAASGKVDCAGLKDALASMIVNWQVVIGLSNSPTSEWAQIPIGTIAKFGDQLAAMTATLGSDADASDALSFMSGANDIVQRGLGGDTAAQADLATYMGADISASIGKQLPISLAYSNAGCS
ncbi:MAG: hypothetical protein ABI706_06130, partial [Ilumatobacteraceae bacterium]